MNKAMEEINIASRVRGALEMTRKEAGALIFDYDDITGYKMFRRWENGDRAISKPLESHFNLILHMINTLGLKATKKLIGNAHDKANNS